MTPSVDSSHRGKWFALLFHVKSVMITFHITEIQLKELHEWYTAYLQLRTSVVYLFKTNQPLKWWLLFFLSNDRFLLKIFGEIGIPGRADSFEFEVVDIWKSCMWTAEWRKIMAVIYTSFAVAKRKPEKKTWIFFRLSFPNCKSCLYNSDDLPSCSLNLLPAVENQNWHWPGPARCDLLLVINKLFRDPTPYIRKSPSLQNNVATERAASSSQG